MPKAKSLILAGKVYVEGKKIDKAGTLVPEDSEIKIKEGLKFVSRGGLKLEQALEEFQIKVNDFTCIDIGASSGGFTDCLLQNGAKKVYAIDVGYGQLDWKLRSDSRVVVIEKTNIRNLDLSLIKDKIDLIVIDVSFIGLEKVFPKVDEIIKNTSLKRCSRTIPLLCKEGVGEVDVSTLPSPSLEREGIFGNIIALIKPQFQVAKDKVGKGGVIRDQETRQEAIEIVKKTGDKLGWKFQALSESPIKGPKGNVEYLIWFEVLAISNQ